MRYRIEMRFVFIALALGACSFHPGALAGDAASDQTPHPDAAGQDVYTPDVAIPDVAASDAIEDACVVVSDLGVNLCPMTSPGPALEISASTSIHTDDGMTTPANPAIACAMMKGGSTPSVCAIYATSITIDANVTLSATGGKPLVLIATQSIDLEGVLDVASHIGGATGPASPNPSCQAGTNPKNAGGGQGGSYETSGAGGGDEDGAAGTAGAAGATVSIAKLAGGCPGANGGGGGAGGAGGGVVLISTPSLTIGTGGAIDASGAAGHGAAAGRHGGGGAGSGGLIAINAAIITMNGNAQIFANGSNGGGGSSSNPASNGADPTGAASGGSGGASGGSGGAGATGATRAAAAVAGHPGTNNNDGGGGGGGGAGAIYIRPMSAAVMNNPNVSPAPI